MRRVADWLPCMLGLLLLATLVSLQWPRIVRGQNDFAALYAGGRLVGTPDLYSRTANQAVIKSAVGVTMESVVYTRPPFYAVLLKPLTVLPYRAAYGLFCALCLASIGWFVIRFSKECPALSVYASFFIPVATFLPQGQDTPLLLLFVGGSILLTRQGREFLAGLVLSLCAIKFHLFLLLPVLLLLKKRWRILAGALAGIGILSLLGIIVAGPDSFEQYVAVLRDPWINFSADMMPNLHGLAATSLGGSTSHIEFAAVCAVVLAFAWACSRTEDYEFLFAIGLLSSLLVSYHSGISDQILLLPAFVLLTRSCMYKPLRIALALSLTPLPYFTGLPVSVIVPPMLFAVLILMCAAMWQPERNLAGSYLKQNS